MLETLVVSYRFITRSCSHTLKCHFIYSFFYCVYGCTLTRIRRQISHNCPYMISRMSLCISKIRTWYSTFVLLKYLPVLIPTFNYDSVCVSKYKYYIKKYIETEIFGCRHRSHSVCIQSVSVVFFSFTACLIGNL